MFYKCLLIILEIISFFSMGLFSDYKKLEKKNKKEQEVIWRIVCIIPLLILSVIQCFEQFNHHNLIILIILIISLFADTCLIYNTIIGMILFFILHTTNIVSLINISFLKEYLNFILFYTITALSLFIVFFKLLKKLFNNNVKNLIFCLLYTSIQFFGLYSFHLYKQTNYFIGHAMFIGEILFLICDVQVIFEIIIKNKNLKYNDELHIITNNIFYYSALIMFIISTFSIK